MLIKFCGLYLVALLEGLVLMCPKNFQLENQFKFDQGR